LKDQPKNLRLTRTEKLKQKDKDLDDIIGKESEESKEDVAFDLYDAVDLLTKYDVAWVDKTLELTKWNEKKAALEELLKDSDVPKIKEGDYGNISRMLKKLVGDPNVVVSQAAVKVCGNLAKGIR
jgi:cytoskeleton-associated protein 5